MSTASPHGAPAATWPRRAAPAALPRAVRLPGHVSDIRHTVGVVASPAEAWGVT